MIAEKYSTNHCGLFHSGGIIGGTIGASTLEELTSKIVEHVEHGGYVEHPIRERTWSEKIGPITYTHHQYYVYTDKVPCLLTPGEVVLNLDGRTIARSVVRYAVERAARGPSSLVGGSLSIN